MNPPPLKVAFAGTPEFALPSLQSLIDSAHEVISVYTQPDRPAGRGKQLRASPVKQLAQRHQLAIYQPQNFKDVADIETLKKQQPDVLVVVAYGLILPQPILDIPRYGCLNVHASLLPRWRGAAPIQRAILAGDSQTGVSIMQMAAGLDTGGILDKTAVPIPADSSAQDLHDVLAQSGAAALLNVVDRIADNTLSAPQAQDEALASYAHKLSKQEARIDWSQDAIHIDRQIRAFNPWPVAFTSFSGQPLRIWKAAIQPQDHAAEPGNILSMDNAKLQIAAGKDSIILLEVQPAGKRRMPIADFIHARKRLLAPGQLLK